MQLDPAGKLLKTVKYTDYVTEQVRTMYPSASMLYAKWTEDEERLEISRRLEEEGIQLSDMAIDYLSIYARRLWSYIL